MINFLKGDSFSDTIQNLIIFSAIILLAVFIIYLLIKHKRTRPIILYSLATIFIISGIFCGIAFVKGITAKSEINGSSVTLNKFSEESFKYHVSSIELYGESAKGDYLFTKKLLPLEDFNGKEYVYEIILNDYKLPNVEISAGNVNTTITIEFYDTNGELLQSSELEINVNFFTDRTELKLSTTGEYNELYLENYFKNNGFRLDINKIGEKNHV